jgi:hypothetical protein
MKKLRRSSLQNYAVDVTPDESTTVALDQATSFYLYTFLAYDKDLFDTLLRGHLSPKSCFYDQILPQIVPFVILGIWNVISAKWSILELFGRFYAQE